MKQKKQMITILFLSVGFLMIFLGILRKEHQTVLDKAVKICLECIGIG